MGSHTPSRFRREGREAFDPNTTPEEINPYIKRVPNFWSISNSENWLEGWREAEASYVEPDDCSDYTVMARYSDDQEEEAGDISLRIINSCHDMPIELEINGVVYKPEF